MKKITLVLLMIFLMLPASAFAFSTEIVPNAEKVETGNVLQLEVDFRENGIGAVYASFSYDAALLEFLEGDSASADNGQGTIVLYASSASANRLQTVLKFRAKAMGTAQIEVSVKEALSFEEEPLSTSSVAAEISLVRPADSYVIVNVGEKRMHALCTPPYIPDGFTAAEIEIAGKTVTAAASGETVYVYLAEPDCETGSYYRREDGNYLPAVSVSSEKILLPMPQSEIPDGFSPASFAVDGAAYEGCSDGSRNLVYACTTDGSPAFYLYDESDNSLQQYQNDVLTLTKPAEAPVSYDYTRPIILGAVFIALLLGILITAIVKRNR